MLPKNTFLASTLSVFAVLVCCGSFCFAEPKTSSLKVGGLLHLTGEIAVQGEAFQEGIELAANIYNSKNPSNKVELFFQDTEYKPAVALSGAKRLVMQHVDAILISTATETKAVAPTLHQAQTPAIVLWDSSPELESLGEYIFAIGPWTPASGEQAAQYSLDTFKAKKAYIIDTDTEWSQSVSKYFRQYFTAHEGEVIGSDTTLPSEQDFRTIFYKVKAAHADVVYAPVDGSIPQFFRQRKQLGISTPTVTSDILTEDYFKQDAAIYEGLYTTQTVPPEGNELKTAYENYFHKPCTQLQFVAWGYDGLLLLANAYAKDPTNFRQALADTKGYPGASGEISFSPNRSAPREVGLYEVLSGNLVRQ